MHLRIQLLGGFSVEGLSPEAIKCWGQKEILVLAYLAHFPGWHSREELASLFWGRSETAQARISLRVALHHLRQHLNGLIESTRTHVRLSPAMYQCDSRVFLELAERAFTSHQEPTCQQFAREALRLYRGEFLPTAPPLRWVVEERDKIHRLSKRLESLIDLVQASAVADDAGGEPPSGLYLAGSIRIIPPPSLPSKQAAHSTLYHRVARAIEEHAMFVEKANPFKWNALFASVSKAHECLLLLLFWVFRSEWRLESLWDIVEVGRRGFRFYLTKLTAKSHFDGESVVFTEPAVVVWRKVGGEFLKDMHFEAFATDKTVYYRVRFEPVSESLSLNPEITSPQGTISASQILQQVTESLLSKDNCVTCLHGVPGIGKTHLAMQVARNLAPAFGGGTVVLRFTDAGHPISYERQLCGALSFSTARVRNLPSAVRVVPKLVCIDGAPPSDSLIGFLRSLHQECPRWKILFVPSEGMLPQDNWAMVSLPTEGLLSETHSAVEYLKGMLRAQYRDVSALQAYLEDLALLCERNPTALRIAVGLLTLLPIEDLLAQLCAQREAHPGQSGLELVMRILLSSLPEHALALLQDMSLIGSILDYSILSRLHKSVLVEPAIRLLFDVGVLEDLPYESTLRFWVRPSVRKIVLATLYEGGIYHHKMKSLFLQVRDNLLEMLTHVGKPNVDLFVYDAHAWLASLLFWATAHETDLCAQLLIRLCNRWSVMGLAELSKYWIEQLQIHGGATKPANQAQLFIEKARAEMLASDPDLPLTIEAYEERFLSEPELKAVHADFYHLCALYHFHRKEYERALRAVSLGLQCSEWAPPHRRIALIGTKGNIYLSQGNLEQAYNCYLRACSMAHEIGHQLSENIARIALADVLIMQGQYEEAEKNIRSVLEDSVGAIYEVNYASWLTAPTLLALYQNRLPQAITLAEESFSRLQRSNRYRDSASSAYLHAVGLASSGQIDALESFYERLRLVFLEEKEVSVVRLMKQIEGILSLHKGMVEKAEELLRSSMEDFNPFDNILFYISGMVYLAQAYHLSHREELAKKAIEELDLFICSHQLAFPGCVYQQYHALKLATEPNNLAYDEPIVYSSETAN